MLRLLPGALRRRRRGPGERALVGRRRPVRARARRFLALEREGAVKYDLAVIGGGGAAFAAAAASDLIDLVHVFPTYSEVVKIAARAFKRDIRHMSCCVE